MRPVAAVEDVGNIDDEDAEAAEDAEENTGPTDTNIPQVETDIAARHTDLHGVVFAVFNSSFCVLSNLCVLSNVSLCVLIRIQNQNTTCAAAIGSRCTRPPSRALS